MKLETYLNAMETAHYRWLDALSSDYTDRKYRQWKKFKAHILAHAIWFDSSEWVKVDPTPREAK